uniref:Putative capsid protein n=1 Tax=viral metagenome TaxID=1070528 RepID=A0A6M3J1I2_9ZZZZ
MPTPSQLRTNAAATGLSVRYRNPSYIADRAFPVLNGITKDEGSVHVYNKENLSAIDAAGPLSPRAPAPEADWTPTSVTYALERYALKELVLQEEIDNADVAFSPEDDAVLNLTDRLLVIRELKAATVMFTAGNWGSSTTLSGTSQWNDDTSDPLGVIETASDALFTPFNTIVMGKNVWSEIRHHPDVTQRFQYTTGGGVTLAQFASLFESDDGSAPQIMVGSAKQVTSEEGVAVTTGYIWGKHLWVGYVDPAPGLRALTACATLQRGQSRTVTEWDNNDPEGMWKRVQDRYLHKVIASDLGYLVVDAVA